MIGFGSAGIPVVHAQDSARSQQADRAAERVEDLDLRYAEIAERIAEINLRKARDTNDRVSGTISDTDLQRLRENLRLARRDVERLKGSSGGGNDERLREARARASVAEGELRKARAANRRVAGTVPDLEIQRLKLEFEAAQVNVARQQAAADVPTALAEMKQQLGDLRKEVTRLRRQFSQFASDRSSARNEEVRTGAASRD